MKNIVRVALLSMTFVTFAASAAETTAPGKIVVAQGHINPACRVVVLKENASGSERAFRIADVAGDDSISAVVLAALVSQFDVLITFEPGQTTGCGEEAKILYISMVAPGR